MNRTHIPTSILTLKYRTNVEWTVFVLKITTRDKWQARAGFEYFRFSIIIKTSGNELIKLDVKLDLKR